jgi:hypothetical protein
LEITLGGLSINNISPQLAKTNYKSKFTITGSNFVTDSSVVVKFGNGDIIQGIVVSSTVITVDYAFPYSGNFTFQISFDGNSSFVSSPILIFVYGNYLYFKTLDVIAGLSPIYSTSNFPDEVGCSPFGFNNFTLGMFSGVPLQLRKNISLSIIDKSFKKATTSCVWKNQLIECVCLPLTDVTIQFPNSYQMTINVNEVEKIPLTDSSGNNVLLTYFNPSYFFNYTNL